MSLFGAHRNRGLMTEPGYGSPKPAVYSYSAASRQSYAASTEQVIQYGSPTNMELHKIPGGVGDHNPLLRRVFGPPHHDRVSKGDHRSSPPTNGSPDHRNKFHSSSPQGDHHYGKYKNYSSDESDDEEEKDVICKDGVCYPKPKNLREEDYERERNNYNHTAPHPIISHPKKDPYHETSHNPYNEKPINTYNPHNTHNEKPINSYNPPSYTVPVQDHPKKHNPHDHNYPSRHTGSKPSFEEDNPHNSYAAPPYAAPISTHPKKDPYPRDGYYDKPKGGSYNPPSYAAQPKKDLYHDAANRPMMYNNNPPASIRTKPERGIYDHDDTSSPKSPFSPSPRKDHHQETIDSMEARRRYGKVSSPMGGADVEKNKGVIDSQEAAKKYNGIFLNY